VFDYAVDLEHIQSLDAVLMDFKKKGACRGKDIKWEVAMVHRWLNSKTPYSFSSPSEAAMSGSPRAKYFITRPDEKLIADDMR
jgi:hypothetical protein